MSLRLPAVCFALLAALCATAGCSRRGAGQAPSSAPSALARADTGRGKAVYEAQCSACHGARGAGGPVGPALRNESLRRPYRQVYALIRDPAPPMPKLYPSRLTESDLRDVSAYVETL